MITSNNPIRPLDHLQTFLDMWRDGILLHDIGPKLSCSECEALCDVFHAFGYLDAARDLREGHAIEDEDDGMPEHVAIRDRLNRENAAEGVRLGLQ